MASLYHRIHTCPKLVSNQRASLARAYFGCFFAAGLEVFEEALADLVSFGLAGLLVGFLGAFLSCLSFRSLSISMGVKGRNSPGFS